MDRRPTGSLEFDIRKDPYNFMSRLVFSRWKPYILRAMDFDEDNLTHFAQFTKQLPISPKVLAQNLREMEKDGLIFRTVLPQTPPQVEYRLTDVGRSLIPLLDAVYDWGWREMNRRGMPIDALGEMWHGYRERDPELMRHPYKTKRD